MNENPGPAIDLGFLSLPAEVQQAVETPELFAWPPEVVEEVAEELHAALHLARYCGYTDRRLCVAWVTARHAARTALSGRRLLAEVNRWAAEAWASAVEQAERERSADRAELQRLQQRLTVTTLVTVHWRNAMLAAEATRSFAHPLACVVAALSGETDPRELGIDPGVTYDALAALTEPPADMP